MSAAAPSVPTLKPPYSSCGALRGGNALCWGVRDLTSLSFDDAARTARAEKFDKFIWNGARYIVKADVRVSGLPAEQQLAKNGITDDQYNHAYVPGISERIFERVTPAFYNHLLASLHAYQGEDGGVRNELLQGRWPGGRWPTISVNPRLDSWALYLGLPQRFDTYRVSPYKPAGAYPASFAPSMSFTDHAMDDALVSYALKKLPAEADDRQSKPSDSNARMLAADDRAPELKPTKTDMAGFNGNKAMGHFVLERRSDERGHYVAYSYTWNLTPIEGLPLVGLALQALHVPTPEASDVAGVGHPFAIYGRVYYDPATGKRLDLQP